MKRVMPYLRDRFPFLESSWFGWIYGLVVFLNPIAMLPQLWGVITTRNIEGLSLTMFVIFWSIQTAVALGAIKTLDWKLFLSMFISVIETATITGFVIWIRYL